MYEYYCKLRDSLKVKDADVARATGITRSTFTDWKNGRSTPKHEKLKKIADYFGVSVESFDQKERDNFFNDKNAEFALKIRNDFRLSSALDIFFCLPDRKKKHVIELIELLNE